MTETTFTEPRSARSCAGRWRKLAGKYGRE